jgi:hypothetical protein
VLANPYVKSFEELAALVAEMAGGHLPISN